MIRFLLVLLAVLAWAFNPAWAGKRVAMLVGNAGYQTLPRLRHPIDDVSALAAKLRGLGFERPTVVTDADRGALLNAVRAFRGQMSGVDLAVMYFAGHSLPYRGETYLLPTDLKIDNEADLPDVAVSVADLVRHAQAGGATKTLVIIDAGAEGAVGSQLVKASQRAGRTSEIGAGLRQPTLPPEMIVWYATEPGATVHEAEGANGTFAAALLDVLAIPGLSSNGLLREVQNRVRPAGLRPRVYGAFSQVAFLHPVPPQDPEGVACEQLRRGVSRAEAQAYLTTYPGGRCASLAQTIAQGQPDFARLMADLRPMPAGQSFKMSEVDMIRAQIERCWNVTDAVKESRVVVSIRVQVKPDGSVQSASIVNMPNHPDGSAAAKAALRAVMQCSPLKNLPAEKYDAWKDMILRFDPANLN